MRRPRSKLGIISDTVTYGATSETVRRPRFFKQMVWEYPVFSGWEKALVDASGVLTRLDVVRWGEMPSLMRGSVLVTGPPNSISFDRARGIVEVWPVPDQEYDLIVETKSWSGAE